MMCINGTGQPPVDVPRVTIKVMNSNLDLDTAGGQQMGAGFTLENGTHHGFQVSEGYSRLPG